MNNVLVADNIHQNFQDGKNTITVLQGINLALQAGEKIAIVGISGSGKSTLLHILGGLAVPSEGQVHVLDNNLSALTETKRCQLRNHHLGFVYQFHHLLPEFNAVENVAMPLWLQNMDKTQAHEQAANMLKAVGLEKRLTHKPQVLSGGERQRVAIARALVHKPACVLADEPTGNLDEHTADAVASQFLQLNETHGTSLIIATHDQRLAGRMDKVYHLRNGQLQL